MTFPQVAAVNGGKDSEDVTEHTVNLPGGIQAEDLLLVFFATDGAPTITFPNGWVRRISHSSGTSVRLAAAYKIADGTEGATITVTTSSAQMAAHISYRITGYTGTPSFLSESSGGGESVNPDPPSLSPPWEASDTLWFAACAWDGAHYVSDYPTNYTNGYFEWISGPGACGVGACRRELNAESEDPGTFTISNDDQWVACTIAIRPLLVTTAYKDIAARFKLWAQTYKDTATRFKLTILAYKDTATRFILTALNYQDIATRFKLTVRAYQDVATRFKLIAQGYSDIAARFKLLPPPPYQDVSTRFFLYQPSWKTLQILGDIAALEAKIAGLKREPKAHFEI